MMIYLDNAATTRPDINALEDAIRSVHESYGNPSSSHGFGEAARENLEKARKTLASSIGCAPKELYFVSGGTEANNLALNGAAELGELVLSSRAEHPSVTDLAVEKVEVSKTGRYDLDAIELRMKALQKWKARKTLALSLANAETGVIGLHDNSAWDLCQKYGWSLHIDAVAAYMKMPLGFKCDSMSVSAHKIGGLKGVGALYVREGYKLHRIFGGGSQERGMRPGTENLLGILHFAAVVGDGKPIQDPGFQKVFEAALTEYATVNGSAEPRVWSLSNLFFDKVKDAEEFADRLEQAGVVASTKAACSSGMIEPSRVLQSMYGPDSPESRGSIRFSFGSQTTMEEVKMAAEIVKRVLVDT